MAGRLILDAVNPALDANGKVIAGSTLTFYENGTTILQSIYADSSLATPLENPVTADSAGRFPVIWGDDETVYSVMWSDAIGGLIATFDDIAPQVEAIVPTSYLTTAAMLTHLATVGNVPTNLTFTTAGRDTAGDGGAGTFYFDPSDITSSDNGGTVRVDGAGHRVKAIVHGGIVDMAVFGLKYQTPTKVMGLWVATDDLAAWNQAIAWAAATKNFTLQFSGPTFISAPLLLSTFNGSAYSGYQSVSIKGKNKPFADPASGAAVYHNFVDCFPIGVQNGRCNTLEDFYLIGNGTAEATITTSGSGGTNDYSTMMDIATYTANSVRDDRYSPYSGICIDPFGTTAPTGAGYPGFSDHYASGAAGSSGVTIKNVVAENFTVAFMISPNGQTQNAENISLYNCYGDYSKSGVAVGQSQSRNVNLYNFNGGFNHFGINTLDYGLQQGACPNIFGANLSGKYLFWCGVQYGSAPILQGIWAESFASIGAFGKSGATGGQPVTLNGSFNFSDWATSGSVRSYPDFHMIAFCPVKFVGSRFGLDEMAQGTPLRFFHQSHRGYDFDTCELPCANNELALAFVVGTTGLQFDGINFRNCTVKEGTRGPASGISRLDSQRTLHANASYLDGQYMAPGEIVNFSGSGNNATLYVNGSTEDQQRVSLGSIAVTVGANGTATFTATDATVIRTGDIIVESDSLTWRGLTSAVGTNAIGSISNISGTTITITGVPESLVSGTYSLNAIWWERAHQASVGDVSTASPTLANVTNATSWLAGHKVKAVGVKTGSYATATGSGSSLTISSTPTATNTGQRLYGADLRSIATTAV